MNRQRRTFTMAGQPDADTRLDASDVYERYLSQTSEAKRPVRGARR